MVLKNDNRAVDPGNGPDEPDPSSHKRVVERGHEKGLKSAVSGPEHEVPEMEEPALEDPADSGLDLLEMPSKLLTALTVAGMGAALLAAFALNGGDPQARVAALCLMFLAGGLAVWRLRLEDWRTALIALRSRDERIERYKRRCEELEDRTWELRESDEKHASILGALGDIVVRRDADGTIVYANSAASEVFDPQCAPVIGAPLELPVIEDSPHDGSTPDCMRNQGIAFGDLHLQTVNGPRWFSRLDVPVRDGSGDRQLSQTVLRDVTERRLIEEELLAARHSAETSNEAKSRFLATVSHEIRTPLNGILGMAALLRDTRITKEQSAYIDALETSGGTLLMLIDEVLDFSKVEAGKLEIQTEPVRLGALTESVIELLAPRAHAKNLEVGARLHPALPETVTLDPSRVRQILFNLAGNGIKFTETGGVSIEIDGRANPEGGSFLDIIVRDTGIGFDKDEADRLFLEFEQIDHGPARKFGGTGLGLAIAQRLANLMGGSIRAASEANRGAAFSVTLPVPEALEPGYANKPFLGKSVAVISTSQVEGPLLCDRLAQEGADVALMTPGADDLSEKLAHADLVVVDNASVADSAGWLVAARLAGCNAPAVVLITPTERDRLDRLREAGFAAYLIRPVRTDTLGQVVRGLLDDDKADRVWDAGVEPKSGGQEPSGAAANSRPLRLLVAEDNDINRLLGEALLRKLGHEPTMVVDGERAVEAAADTDFDAILMDLHMPGLDGVEAIEKIRAHEQDHNRPQVPVLMVTADVMQDARERATAAGAAGYLTKPLSEDAIRTALDQLAKP